MRMSTKGRFAVNAMIDLALRQAVGPVPLVGVAKRQGISLSYLEQMFAALRGRDLVRPTRGPGGGYSLGRDAKDISVADIVDAVDELGPAAHEPQARADDLTDGLWLRLDEAVRALMQQISLDSLVQQHAQRGFSVELPRQRSPIAARAPATKPATPRTPNSVFAWGAALAA